MLYTTLELNSILRQYSPLLGSEIFQMNPPNFFHSCTFVSIQIKILTAHVYTFPFHDVMFRNMSYFYNPKYDGPPLGLFLSQKQTDYREPLLLPGETLLLLRAHYSNLLASLCINLHLLLTIHSWQIRQLFSQANVVFILNLLFAFLI